MATEEKKQRLEFRGGMFGLFVPFIIMLGGILFLSINGKALPMAFWVPTLAGIAAALALSKKPADCAEALIEGISDKTVIMIVDYKDIFYGHQATYNTDNNTCSNCAG